MFTVMSVNVQRGGVRRDDGSHDDRWPGLVGVITAQSPDLVLLQEVGGWQEDLAAQHARAEADLGMRVHLTPSVNSAGGTAIAHGPLLCWTAIETRYAARTLHGFTHLALDIGQRRPLVVISAHLTPYSAQTAAQELQLIIGRAYRYGGIGLIGGDMNHIPLGDPEPDWTRVHPYNRSSRTHPAPDDTPTGNRIVSATAHQADLTDVAAHLADTHHNPLLRAPTGHHGGIRVDWFLATPAVLPAISTYRRVPTHPHSDHDAIVVELDETRIDLSQARPAT